MNKAELDEPQTVALSSSGDETLGATRLSREIPVNVRRPIAWTWTNRASLALVLASNVTTVACRAPRTSTQEPASSAPAKPVDIDLFHDAEDGAFDVSQFLASRTGFLPLAMPITEPAVGYGLGVGLAFFHEKPRMIETENGPRMIPPIATAVGGMATENGSWGAFAGHLHNWNDGDIRYLVGGGYGSLNLDWFGQSDAFEGRKFSYNIDGLAVIQKLTFKLGDSDFFVGPTQRFLSTTTDFDGEDNPPPLGSPLGIQPDELDATVSGLGATVSYDTRNSLFSPTQGTKASASYTQNDEAIGSDFDYGGLDAEACHYLPLGGEFTLGLRGLLGYASEDAPFFDLASIQLRGIPRGRYIDNVALTLEEELRWDCAPRWTIVGFGGVGWAADALDELDDADDRWAGGTGFRYLIARAYDMRLGCDIARGPEDWAFYVTLGTGWLRD
jgi:hypothetical protein